MATQYIGGASFPTIDCRYDTSVNFWGRSIIRKHKFNIKILSRNFIPHALGWSIHCNLMAAIQFLAMKALATKPARGISFSHDILPRLTR